MANQQYSEQYQDEYQEGILDDSKQRKVGFLRHWLNIGRDSAMKGLDIGNNAVNKITETIQKGMEAKYQAEIAKAEAEAKAKYGAGTADYEEAIKKATEEAYEKFRSEEALRKAEEEAAKQAADRDDEFQGHTEEEWVWEASEDGMSGKWTLKKTS